MIKSNYNEQHEHGNIKWYGTTILCIRKNDEVIIQYFEGGNLSHEKATTDSNPLFSLLKNAIENWFVPLN